MDPWILKLQQEAIRIASRYRCPEFYVRFKAPMALARRLYFSDSIVVFRLNQETGEPVATSQTLKVGSPVCLLFQPVSE